MIVSMLVCSLLLTLWASASNPTSMVMVLLLVSLAVCLTVVTQIGFWYSSVVFLVVIGGLLVLVIYIVMVGSNYVLTFKPFYMIPSVLFMSLVVALTSNWERPAVTLGYNPMSNTMSSSMAMTPGALLLVTLVLLVVLVTVSIRLKP